MATIFKANLKKSTICRLCAAVNCDGKRLFQPEKQLHNLVEQIHRLEILKLRNDPRYPDWICSLCIVNIENTHVFFAKVNAGQVKLLEMAKATKLADDRTEGLGANIRGRHVRKPKDDPPHEIQTNLTEPDQHRRQRKPLARFGMIQGEELDRIFDDDSADFVDEIIEGDDPCPALHKELIGHVRTSTGADLGELLLLNVSQAILGKGITTSRRTSLMCNVCSQRFRSENLFFNHSRSHQLENVKNDPTKESEMTCADDLKIVCKFCEKGFKSIVNLLKHSRVHSSERPFACDDCSSRFKTKQTLANHRKIHEGVKTRRCYICDKQFLHLNSLQLHLRWHRGEKPFACEICDKSFTQIGNLREHHRIHSGERPFTCKYCSKSFKTSSQRRTHMLLHRQNGETMPKFRVSKPARCTVCASTFREHWNLVRHMRVHTEEKPFACERCGKKFADSSNLAKHSKMHDQARSLLLPKPERPANVS